MSCCCCGFECCCAKIVVRLMGVVHGCCPLFVGGLWLGGCGLLVSLGNVLSCGALCCGVLFACLYFSSVFLLIAVVGFGGMFPCRA